MKKKSNFDRKIDTLTIYRTITIIKTINYFEQIRFIFRTLSKNAEPRVCVDASF